MHLNNYGHRHDVLIDWIVGTLPSDPSVLDVGANDGSFCPEIVRVAKQCKLFAGVDPDRAKIERHPLLHVRYPGLLEEASIPADTFDCLYAIYVFEHVADAEGFLASAARVLKPGGSLFFITPNGLHYFSMLASALGRFHLQERTLRLIRPKELVGRYHYPALYRMNRPKELIRMGRLHGFSEFEFRYSESFEEFACYFPGPLKGFVKLWEKIAETTKREHLLGNLMGRMIKCAS